MLGRYVHVPSRHRSAGSGGPCPPDRQPIVLLTNWLRGAAPARAFHPSPPDPHHGILKSRNREVTPIPVVPEIVGRRGGAWGDHVSHPPGQGRAGGLPTMGPAIGKKETGMRDRHGRRGGTVSERELIALGTGSLAPTRDRNQSGHLLRWGSAGILFDPGEGTQRQMILAGVPARRVRIICLTHLHGDHCLGLPGVLQRLSLDRVPHPVTLAYPAGGQKYVDRLRAASIYHDEVDLRLLPLRVGSEPVEVVRTSGLILSAAALAHRVDAVGYRVQDPPGRVFDPGALADRGIAGPLVGRLRREGSLDVDGVVTRLEDVTRERVPVSFALVQDTRPCEGARRLADGVDLLVMEATYLSDLADKAREYGHSTALEAGRLAAAAGARSLALTHFSSRYRSTEAHVAEAGRAHGDVVALADLDRVRIP